MPAGLMINRPKSPAPHPASGALGGVGMNGGAFRVAAGSLQQVWLSVMMLGTSGQRSKASFNALRW